MMICIFLTLILFYNTGFSSEWTKNNILKFSMHRMSNLDFLSDYEDITLTNGVIKSLSDSAWLYSKPIEVKEGLFVDRAFININTTNNGKIRMRIIDYNTDEIIGEKIIFSSGIINLKDFFRKNLYFSIEFFDTNVEILSFGLRGKPSKLLNQDDLIVEPVFIFHKEDILLIKFKLGKPSFVDVLIFNKNTLVDTIMKETFLKNGEVVITYDMAKNQEKFLATGTQWVYIKAKSTDEKIEEITQSFYYVKD